MGRNDEGPAVHPARAAVQARRKRRRNLLVLGVVAAVAISQVWTAWAGRDREEGSSAVPGYDDTARTIDTSPFKLAVPDNTAPTTSPVDYGSLASRRTTTIPPPTVPPVTLPAAAGDPRSDPVCNAVGKLYDLNRDSGDLAKDPPNLAKVSATALLEAAELLEGTGDAQFQPAVTIIRDIASQVAGQTDLDQIADILHPLLLTPTPEVSAASAPVFAHAARICPGFVARHTS